MLRVGESFSHTFLNVGFFKKFFRRSMDNTEVGSFLIKSFIKLL